MTDKQDTIDQLLGALILCAGEVPDFDGVVAAILNSYPTLPQLSITWAIVSVMNRGYGCDPTTIRDLLSRSGHLDAIGGFATVASLIDGLPRTTNIGRLVSELTTQQN